MKAKPCRKRIRSGGEQAFFQNIEPVEKNRSLLRHQLVGKNEAACRKRGILSKEKDPVGKKKTTAMDEICLLV